jgi:TorA maturation chaperone TorD
VEKAMTRHSHHFVETYDGLVGFGLNRETDENTIIYYLQKFSDDELMRQIVPKMKDAELSEIFELISRMLKRHLSEADYHRLFLKDEDHE